MIFSQLSLWALCSGIDGGQEYALCQEEEFNCKENKISRAVSFSAKRRQIVHIPPLGLFFWFGVNFRAATTSALSNRHRVPTFLLKPSECVSVPFVGQIYARHPVCEYVSEQSRAMECK